MFARLASPVVCGWAVLLDGRGGCGDALAQMTCLGCFAVTVLSVADVVLYEGCCSGHLRVHCNRRELCAAAVSASAYTATMMMLYVRGRGGGGVEGNAALLCSSWGPALWGCRHVAVEEEEAEKAAFPLALLGAI
ncbi:unnamed protein product [Mesocestoides corti]|uniref:Uncharacterized protein n=1 Tax=Mesocestoides corti TaxID=53468 RepID=A0A0R3UDC4_MESCO|nr:unnamed protein product [Mesocestoides corti]